MENEDLERQLLLIENNVNVSKTNDGKEFLILVSGLIGLLLVVIMFADFFANILITCLPTKSQIKIEKIFGNLPADNCLNDKYSSNLVVLQKIRKRITDNDKTLINNGRFPIIFVENKALNAWIMPNGAIYFTTTLLDKNFSEEELAFILAHEIGHYKNRDHLRSISRQIIISLAAQLFFSGSDKNITNTVKNINEFANYSHSRQQERNADLYANNMLIKLYNSNAGGVKFFSYLKKLHNEPEFLQYFLTHPSPQKRLYLITHQ